MALHRKSQSQKEEIQEKEIGDLMRKKIATKSNEPQSMRHMYTGPKMYENMWGTPRWHQNYYSKHYLRKREEET